MAGVTRLEHFAGLAMQGIIALMRGSSMSDEQLARRAFEIGAAMDAEAAKHNLDDRAERAGEERARQVAAHVSKWGSSARAPAGTPRPTDPSHIEEPDTAVELWWCDGAWVRPPA